MDDGDKLCELDGSRSDFSRESVPVSQTSRVMTGPIPYDPRNASWAIP